MNDFFSIYLILAALLSPEVSLGLTESSTRSKIKQNNLTGE
jgi:hypothetical protein